MYGAVQPLSLRGREKLAVYLDEEGLHVALRLNNPPDGE
jgi:hypothetical protein